ncbi:hypothetical protein STEG23_033673 [Scotinomys teguina]
MVMLLPGTKSLLLLVQRTVTRTIVLQETIHKGILMQREDVILEWIFLPCKPNKKLKTYIEKISDLIHKDENTDDQVIGLIQVVYKKPGAVDGKFEC